MSPSQILIGLSRRNSIKRRVMRELDRQYLDIANVEYSDEQFAYDKRNLKIDGREG